MKRMIDPLSAPPWPPTSFSLPELWERIAAMFVVLMREARSAAGLAARDTTYTERHAIRCRLIPLETLVRSLLITEAIIHLLMTREGRDLIANAKSATPPSPRTRAKHQTQPDHNEPQQPNNRPAAFRVLGWETSSLDDDAPLTSTTAPTQEDRPTTPISGRHLARRIETLTHVLKDPAPAIQRLAKFLARLPAHSLGAPFVLRESSLGWWHGRPEYFNAIAIEARAVRAFERTPALVPEPRDDPG